MKTGGATTLVSAPAVLAQPKPVYIALSQASSTPAALFVENFPKVGCTNVSIVVDESKADYILEAHEGDLTHSIPISAWMLPRTLRTAREGLSRVAVLGL
jgi:hypothetical protein